MWSHNFLVNEESTFSRSLCMDFLSPFRQRFPAFLLRIFAEYPMQTVMRFSRCGAFGCLMATLNLRNSTDVLRSPGLEINLEHHRVFKHGTEVYMSRYEYGVLSLMAQHRERTNTTPSNFNGILMCPKE